MAFNVAPIVVLVLKGNTGRPDSAVHGLHSLAGWIAFNASAYSTVRACRCSRWLNRTRSASQSVPGINPIAIYPSGALLRDAEGRNALTRHFRAI